MRIGALQPGYLPWLGFFDQILNTDLFILYDDLLYTKKTWRNRNYIKGPNGKILLSVPIRHEEGVNINQARIDNSKIWQRKHLRRIIENYQSCVYYNKYIPFFKKIFEEKWEKLIDLDLEIIYFVLQELEIKTKIILSSEMEFEKKLKQKKDIADIKAERIVFFMKELNGDEFFEGAAGENYINKELLQKKSIRIVFQNYRHPVYIQKFGEFISHLSIIDLLFNHGEKSLDILSDKRQHNE